MVHNNNLSYKGMSLNGTDDDSRVYSISYWWHTEVKYLKNEKLQLGLHIIEIP